MLNYRGNCCLLKSYTHPSSCLKCVLITFIVGWFQLHCVWFIGLSSLIAPRVSRRQHCPRFERRDLLCLSEQRNLPWKFTIALVALSLSWCQSAISYRFTTATRLIMFFGMSVKLWVYRLGFWAGNQNFFIDLAGAIGFTAVNSPM